MNRVLTCVGDYAKSPYYLEKLFVNVYSAEELCFVLYENAFLLDKDMLDRKLAEWVDKELNLSDLARDLYVLLNQNASAAAFVGTILSYVGYYSKAEISKVESILRMNVSMNVFEKWKAKADFLVENNHYVMALSEYERLLNSLEEDERILKASVLNNMGIAYMNLFIFDSAEKCFLNSYELDPCEDTLKHYLTVKRMSLSDEEYIKLIADKEETYQLSISLESRMEELNHSFDNSETAVNLKELFALRDTQDSNTYYQKMVNMTEDLKEEYKDIVLETEKSEAFLEQISIWDS